MKKKNKILISVFGLVLSLTLLLGIVVTFTYKDERYNKTTADGEVQELNTDAPICLTDGASFTMSGGKITVDGPTLSGNTNGGAVYVGNNSTFTMTGGTISNFQAKNGAGIYVAKDGTCKITGGTLENLTATGSGGAIYVATGGKLQITDMSLKKCLASAQNGGNAIYAEAGAIVQFGDIVNGSFSTDRSYSRKNLISNGKGLLISDCGESEGQQYYFEEAETNLQNGNLINIPMLTNYELVNKNPEGEDLSVINYHISDISKDLYPDDTCGFFHNKELTECVTDYVGEFKTDLEKNTFKFDLFSAKFTAGMKVVSRFTNCGSYYSIEIKEEYRRTYSGEFVVPASYNNKPVLLKDCNITFDLDPSYFNKYDAFSNASFYGCSGIRTIYLPTSVTSIPQYSFYNCSELSSVNLHDNLKTISGSKDFSFAFRGCSNLKEVYIPKSLGTIGIGVFYGCPLEKIYVHKENNYFIVPEVNNSDQNTGGNSSSEGTTYSYFLAVDGFYSKESGEGKKYIEAYALCHTNNIYAVTKNVQEGFFKSYIGEELLTIKQYAFCEENEITAVDLKNVGHIASRAFMNCTSLTEIILYDDLKKIDSSAFYNTGLTSVEIPDSVEFIAAYAFQNCVSLKSIKLPSNSFFTNIGVRTFSGCSRLNEITVGNENSPNEELTINESAFEGCSDLKYVNLYYKTIYANSAFTKEKTGRAEDNALVFYLSRYNRNYIASEYDPELALIEAGDCVYNDDSREIPYYVKTKEVHRFIGFSYAECVASREINMDNAGTFAVIVNPDSQNDSGEIVENQKVQNENSDLRDNNFKLFYFSGESLIASTLFANTDLDYKKITCVYLTSGSFGLGEGSFRDCVELTTVTIPKATSIGDSSFYGCEALTNIDLSKVISIGASAFYGCKALTSVTIPEATLVGSSSFGGCSLLKNVSASLVTKIGSNAFNGCLNLINIEMPEVVDIGSGAFIDCSGLTSVNLPKVTDMGSSVFSRCSLLQDINLSKVESIGSYAFSGCSSLINIELPTTNKIGEFAFSGCSALTSVNLSGLTGEDNLGESLFNGCSSLETLNLSSLTSISKELFGGLSGCLRGLYINSVATLPDESFKNFATLQTIEMKSAKEIGVSAFEGCSNLKYVSFAGSEGKNITIKNRAFYGCMEMVNIKNEVDNIVFEGTHHFAECKKLFTVKLPNATTIPASIFENCSSLSYVWLSTDATLIGEKSFKGCLGLTETSYLINSEYITGIGSLSFEGCSNLQSIDFPNVISVGNESFSGCSLLSSVNLSGVTSEDDLGESLFNGCSSLETLNLSSLTSISKDLFSGLSGCLRGLYINSVATLPDESFKNFATLQTIEMKSAKEIGVSAFEGCSNLKYVSFAGSEGKNITIKNRAFYGCMEMVNIKNEVDNIVFEGTHHFAECKKLFTVKLPNATTIPASIFENCSSLSYIWLSTDATAIGRSAFKGCSSMSSTSDLVMEKITNIGVSAFEGCSSLSSISIPNAVTVLNNSVFKGCSSLSSIEMPGVERIFSSVFQDCASLTSISIKNVIDIGDSAFEECTALQEVKDESSVTEIGARAFYHCLNLQSLNSEGEEYLYFYKIKKIGAQAFEFCSSIQMIGVNPDIESIGESAFKDCRSLISILSGFNNFGYSLHFEETAIGRAAFENCTTITSAYLGGINEIEGFVFKGCSNLVKVVAEEVINIGSLAFANTNITKIVTNIDSDNDSCLVVSTLIERVGSNAFAGCLSLTDVDFSNGIDVYFDTRAFENCTGLKSIKCRLKSEFDVNLGWIPPSEEEIKNYVLGFNDREVIWGCFNFEELRIYIIEMNGSSAYYTFTTESE